MIDKFYIDLMNKKIDGLNSSEESENIKKFLKTNEEARNYFEELLNLSGLLDGLEEIRLDSKIKANAFEKIKSSYYDYSIEVNAKYKELGKIRSLRIYPIKLREIAFLAAGLLLAFTLYPFAQNLTGMKSDNLVNLTGTFTKNREGTAADFNRKTTLNFESGFAQINVFQSGKNLLLRIDSASEKVVDLRLNVDHTILRFDTFHNVDEKVLDGVLIFNNNYITILNSDKMISQFTFNIVEEKPTEIGILVISSSEILAEDKIKLFEK